MQMPPCLTLQPETLRKMPNNILLLPRVPEADWKEYKRESAQATPLLPPPSPMVHTPTSLLPCPLVPDCLRKACMLLLIVQTWLHNRPEQDVYKLHIEGDADVDSIYDGARDGWQGFRRFLRLAESRRELLPSWWSQEKVVECEAVGMTRSGARYQARLINDTLWKSKH